MREFDVLAPDAPIFNTMLLEASAGTGKTFTIEHLYARLILEAPFGTEPLLVSNILAITFTNAAARELKMRIRSNLANLLKQLQQETKIPYLKAHIGSLDAKLRLEDALMMFDQAQIFTIHGFCQRILSEFALEAGVALMDSEPAPFHKVLRPYLLDFLEQQEVLCPEQLNRLLREYRGDIESLCTSLLKAPPPSRGSGFTQAQIAIKLTLDRCPHPFLSEEEMLSLFERIKPQFKCTGFDQDCFEDELRSFAHLFLEPTSPDALRRVLFFEGAVWRFLFPENRKKNKQEEQLPELFSWCQKHLFPHLQEALDPKQMFASLRSAWQAPLQRILEERSLFSPDLLLERTHRALEQETFIKAVRSKYQAAIIDEFQDTDLVQWEIFSKLFLQNRRLFCLVGDPKQSIYRFRKADLYTYFQARSLLGDAALYSLGTNYRSTPALLSALNGLFGEEASRPWLLLPREQREEVYRPVKAGLDQSFDPEDGKKALQFFAVQNLGVEALAFVAREVKRLYTGSYSSFAVLIKDHIQSKEAELYLKSKGIPCRAKKMSALGTTFAAHALEELFDAIYFPRDSGKVKLWMVGPFGSSKLENLVGELPFAPELYEWKDLLEKKGVASFFRVFLSILQERIRLRGTDFLNDVLQIMEVLFHLRFPTYEAIKRAFRVLAAADPEEEAFAKRRVDNATDAVHIMTMHASKGLEFDIVFALGAAKPTRIEEEREEGEAEKLRQLYVVLTRAKKRLYVPLLTQTVNKEGCESPLELLWRRSKWSQDPLKHVHNLMERYPSIGLDETTDFDESSFQPVPLEKPAAILPKRVNLDIPRREIYSYSTYRIHSETGMIHSAAQNLALEPHQSQGQILSRAVTGVKTVHTLPKGANTGDLLHRMMQRIFSEHLDPSEIVRQEITGSSLKEWEPCIQELVANCLKAPLFGTCVLGALLEKRAEVEFLFVDGPDFCKGFIDLTFIHEGLLYVLDWKTNWLGADDTSYSQEQLEQAMTKGDYWYQASIYRDALVKAWPKLPFGGSLYVFLRGILSPSRGTLFFQPPPTRKRR